MLPGTVRASADWAHGPVETTLLEGIGHYPHEEAPAAANRALTTFLASAR
jgi:pimeloyl-ACP methyl ester carboxylesterase